MGKARAVEKEGKSYMLTAPRKTDRHSGRDESLGNGENADQELTPGVQWGKMDTSEHFVQFYDTDEFLLDSVSGFIGAGLGAGGACIVVATKVHREGLEERFQTIGLDLAVASARGTYLALDAGETLSKFMVDGMPDPQRFFAVIGGLIERMQKGQRRVRIFGEMVAQLWSEGNQVAAIRLEALWNELYHSTEAFSLFCAYPIRGFAGEGYQEQFTEICQQHSHVIPDESYTLLASPEERLRAVTLLQQKAVTLECEIGERRVTEQRLRASENRYRRLFEASTDGILIVDPSSALITDVNPSLLHLLNSTIEQVMGLELWQVGLLPDKQTQQAFLEQMQQDRLLRYEMLELPSTNGGPRYVEWVSTLFRANGHEVIQCNLRDITDRLQAEEANLYLAAIVSSSEDAIFSKDLDGTITSWNAAAVRMFGYSAQEIVGKPVSTLFPPDRVDEFVQIMERIRRGERVDHYETKRLLKDRSQLSVSVTVSPIKNSRGTIIGASDITRDISKRKELEEQREAFVGLVTHELKNPLTALQGNIQLAQRLLTRLLSRAEQLEEEQRRILEDVLTMLARSHQPLRVQQRLISDLLDLSQIQEGKLELQLATCNLVELVYETVQDYQAAHPSRLITLDLPELDPILVHADRDRLQQVLGNYLANALKFSPDSEPVHVGMDVESGAVRVWVQDHGPGLSAKQQAYLWQRFYRVPGTPIQHGWKRGLGLGLYICRQLISRQQGQVGVESSPGRGARFWFTLPALSSATSIPETN
jgi:PAS domain S-box-containing protein